MNTPTELPADARTLAADARTIATDARNAISHAGTAIAADARTVIADARTAIAPVLSACAKPAAQAEQYVRQHPGGTLLVAAGLGILTLLVARAMTPVPPRNRAVRLLEDIQHRLADLAEGGAHAVDKGLDSLGDLHLDRSLNSFGRKMKSLFQS